MEVTAVPLPISSSEGGDGVKRTITAIILSVLLLLVMPATVLTLCIFLPSQYDETYYGELAEMHERLSNTEGPKILMIGGSSIAFGLDVEMMEDFYKDYTVCPFGLYGAIGTKAMLELALDHISQGDIVIISPEISEQTMSLYFSAQDMWKAMDSDLSMIGSLSGEDLGKMVSGVFSYLSEKLRYIRLGKKPQPDDVYAKASFGGNCRMTYDRPYNQMPLLYDDTALVSYSTELIQKEFIDYINEYYEACYKKGAEVYYNFCPVNRLSVEEAAEIEPFFVCLNESLHFPILGNPQDYLFDAEWFYDSNFHMNTRGMIVYTARVVEDLGRYVTMSDQRTIYLPEKPVSPIAKGEGDNSDEDCFMYELNGNGYQITGLTETGRERTELTVPASHKGQAVWGFIEDTFQGDEKLEGLTIPATIRSIKGGSFAGCTALKRLVMQSATPNCAVDSRLNLEASQLRILVPDYESYMNYSVNYYWSQYADLLEYLTG